MKRLLLLIVVTAPFLMCFQCGCEDPDTRTIFRIENSTDEFLYLSQSAQPWPNADCRWRHLPCTINQGYSDPNKHPGENFCNLMRGDRTSYVLLVDADMHLRAYWSVDSLPFADTMRWVSDSAILDFTNCNDIFPTEYTHTFTIVSDDLMK